MNPITNKIPTNICQPKYFSITIPVWVAAKTIAPAIITPKLIKGKAILTGILNKKAIIDPVQPPVIGKGIATKAIKAGYPYFFILKLYRFLVLVKSQKKNFWQIPDLLESQLETGSKNKRRRTTGTKFPITEIK